MQWGDEREGRRIGRGQQAEAQGRGVRGQDEEQAGAKALGRGRVAHERVAPRGHLELLDHAAPLPRPAPGARPHPGARGLEVLAQASIQYMSIGLSALVLGIC